VVPAEKSNKVSAKVGGVRWSRYFPAEWDALTFGTLPELGGRGTDNCDKVDTVEKDDDVR